MKQFLRRLLRDRAGATAIEYGLIAALLAVSVIGVTTLFGPQVEALINRVTDQLGAA